MKMFISKSTYDGHDLRTVICLNGYNTHSNECDEQKKLLFCITALFFIPFLCFSRSFSAPPPFLCLSHSYTYTLAHTHTDSCSHMHTYTYTSTEPGCTLFAGNLMASWTSAEVMLGSQPIYLSNAQWGGCVWKASLH